MAFYDHLKGKQALIAAHRGHRAIRPENTMSAFETALGDCDFIELDVGFSKDGVAVIIHDDSCKRTSNIELFEEFKNKSNVNDLTYDELLQLDFGSWFIKEDPFESIKNNVVSIDEIRTQQIPTLKQVLQFCKKHALLVNVEIKDLSKTQFHKTAVHDIIEIILNEKIEDLVLISSFNHDYLKEAKQIAPYIQRAALQEKKHPKNLIKYLKKLDVVAYNSEDEIITQEVVQSLKEANIFVNVYTVNSKKRKEELYDLGVDAIFTDCL